LTERSRQRRKQHERAQLALTRQLVQMDGAALCLGQVLCAQAGDGNVVQSWREMKHGAQRRAGWDRVEQGGDLLPHAQIADCDARLDSEPREHAAQLGAQRVSSRAGRAHQQLARAVLDDQMPRELRAQPGGFAADHDRVFWRECEPTACR
jgi:uncharacterized protein (DUF924 family)